MKLKMPSELTQNELIAKYVFEIEQLFNMAYESSKYNFTITSIYLEMALICVQ